RTAARAQRRADPAGRAGGVVRLSLLARRPSGSRLCPHRRYSSQAGLRSLRAVSRSAAVVAQRTADSPLAPEEARLANTVRRGPSGQRIGARQSRSGGARATGSTAADRFGT